MAKKRGTTVLGVKIGLWNTDQSRRLLSEGQLTAMLLSAAV